MAPGPPAAHDTHNSTRFVWFAVRHGGETLIRFIADIALARLGYSGCFFLLFLFCAYSWGFCCSWEEGGTGRCGVRLLKK